MREKRKIQVNSWQTTAVSGGTWLRGIASSTLQCVRWYLYSRLSSSETDPHHQEPALSAAAWRDSLYLTIAAVVGQSPGTSATLPWLAYRDMAGKWLISQCLSWNEEKMRHRERKTLPTMSLFFFLAIYKSQS
ncbi:hypothetical protein CI102_6220 [Trichoderma harzianum]|uniref:Uncharacterized protein n=1 Tax=Trichoderma harzianum CBS 226.95 TaxID=983964 RepID=A0A2T4A084_TRIHA|nr:hypothetical protein M431DRAFT_253910 [Trichoderma harzianum CBS 226.95]PKK47681.1 hypothetical protein CI102_6220 [Trichoderma harzianum]PTB50472.1 hypothetical protein M431DRAFT_253910 [Trichoderma harzianum CBS 226.95]